MKSYAEKQNELKELSFLSQVLQLANKSDELLKQLQECETLEGAKVLRQQIFNEYHKVRVYHELKCDHPMYQYVRNIFNYIKDVWGL